MTNISELKLSSVYIRSRGLEVLENFPLLESLTVSFLCMDSNVIPERLPNRLKLPSLRRIALHDIPSPNILTRFWSLPGMLDGATSLDITYCLSYQPDEVDYVEEVQDSLWSILPGQNFEIQSLSLGHSQYGCPWIDAFNFTDLLCVVSELPLRTMTIQVQEENRF
ncbi:hypothetical protein FRC07_003885, partial [Ceratobasidium sp. 392]